jgi:rfaE bifunctional protein kinase chain/domain
LNVQGILAQFPAMRALVIGDVCLDRWCTYDPALSEPSRETGILRVAVTASENTPGAAGTVASNLAALGVGRVAVLGVIGNDGFGLELERALAERSISTELLIRSSFVSTFTYTKLLNSLTGIEDLPRLDFINAFPLDRTLESQLVDSLREKIHDFDVILVSDQAETATGGVVTAAVRDVLGKIEGKLIWVDSRARAELFRNVILKINREEADAACTRIAPDNPANLQGLREHTHSKLLIVTRGADGATVVGERAGANYETNPPARRVEHPVDICGAGDSFSAGAAMALAVTGSPTEAVEFGHLVASHTIMKKGTGTVTPDELLAGN